MTASGLSAAEIARRSGLSASTIHRIRRGLADPTVGTLREIAIACGFDLNFGPQPLSDPHAAAGARLLLESGYDSSDPSTVEWVTRLTRLAPAENPLEVVLAASAASNPLARPGAVHLAGRATTGMLASAASNTAAAWAISGSPGIDLPPRQAVYEGHALLWTSDVTLVSSLLHESLRVVPHPAIATVTIVTAESQLFTGSFDFDAITFAAPLQIMLDCFAIGGDSAAEAREIVSTW
ncbi:MAG: DNA-binding transcription regulator [Subtercola sp.]|nr:DNA-binding transcription regulator [Subtercola sp.]